MTLPRACGTRVGGAVYVELPLSRTGRPLSDFILCPPREIDLEASGISSIGTKLLRDQNGTYHVFDVISRRFPLPDWPLFGTAAPTRVPCSRPNRPRGSA